MSQLCKDGVFRVKWRGDYPHKKWVFHDGTFSSRQKARQFCRNREYIETDLTIIHPDGSEETWTRADRDTEQEL
jgi:hypothetical protein